jgi:hypothetical protein
LRGAEQFEEEEAALGGIGGAYMEGEIVAAIISGRLRSDGFGCAVMGARFLGNGKCSCEEQHANGDSCAHQDEGRI